jgi:hypothetical protein
VQDVKSKGLSDDMDDLDFKSMAIGKDIVGNPAIFDTGASHGFTGSKFFLHDFCSLKNPILVSVATNGAGSYISGYGDLKFLNQNRNVIVLWKVLSCEQAKATLISMAALWKADASVTYDNLSDFFIISGRNGQHLFTCIFESKRNCWILLHKFIRCNNPTKNGRDLIQVFYSSTPIPQFFSSDLSRSKDPVLPTFIESLDEIDDVEHNHKKSHAKKPITNNESAPLNELADLF